MAGETWDRPNQEVVLAEPPGPTGPVAPDGPGSYDPGDHTVTEVQAYVTEHPDERGAITQQEQAGKTRASLLDWLGQV